MSGLYTLQCYNGVEFSWHEYVYSRVLGVDFAAKWLRSHLQAHAY